MFITIEGVEFTGKSELARSLADYLCEFHPTVLTYEPGGTPMADAIRTIFKGDYSEEISPFTELCLITAAREQHCKNVIGPALRSSKHVICDRYIDSTIVYQGLYMSDKLVKNFISWYPEPHLTFLLTAHLSVLKERARTRLVADRFDRLMEAQEIYQDRFMRLAGSNADRFVHIDTTELSQKEVFEEAERVIITKGAVA